MLNPQHVCNVNVLWERRHLHIVAAADGGGGVDVSVLYVRYI